MRAGRARTLSTAAAACPPRSLLPRRAHALHFKAKQRNRVAESRERVRAEERALRQLDARLLEREQVAGQVAAVHGGDVLRRKRLKRARVIPVEEVAAELRHLSDGVEGQLQSFD